MEYDETSLVKDLNLLDVARKIGLEINDNKPGDPNGNHWQVKCPYHNDRNFGSTFLYVSNNEEWKGLTCFACGEKKHIIQLVADQLNVPRWKAREIIAEDLGGLKQYEIDGTENTWEKNYKAHKFHLNSSLNNNIKNKTVEENYFPDPLTTSQMTLLNLNKFINPNYEVIKEYSYKPKNWELPEGTFLLPKEYPNPDYIENSEPEYNSFLDFINSKKNDKGSSENPFIYTWLLCKKKNMNVSLLYRDNKYLYWIIVYSRILEKINELSKELFSLKGSDNYSSNRRYEIKKNLKELEALKKSYSSKETLQTIKHLKAA